MTDVRFDVLLRGGKIIDGSGAAAYDGSIAIVGERIAAIGELPQARATVELDVSGLVVAPGFIDVHTHDDAALIARPQMAAKITQGVTTVIAGNCGISGAPCVSVENPPHLHRLIFKSEQCVAATFGEYLDKVRAAAPATNAAFLTGHSTLRMQVMGDDLNRPAQPAETAKMQELLRRCLSDGSFGLSTGLFYPTARAASTEEIIDVAKPLQEFGGIYVTHMRDEADGVVESIEESLAIGRAVGTAVVISHHKCMGRRNFGRSTETLAMLLEASRSQEVHWDVYPYTAGSTILNEEVVRVSLRTIITWSDPHPEFNGRDLEDVATSLGLPVSETIPHLQPAGALYFIMDEDDVTRILCSSRAMVGSDGLPEDEHPHPRLWGTFPRVLGRYVRERDALPLENAVHRMTGLSARTFDFRQRGLLKPGFYADICVFDPSTVLDLATYEQPSEPAIGISHVLVNGCFALRDGVLTDDRSGKILRRQDMRSQGRGDRTLTTKKA